VGKTGEQQSIFFVRVVLSQMYGFTNITLPEYAGEWARQES
jgi:hypothetical protein